MEKVFGRNIWDNVVVDVSFWDAGTEHVEERAQERPPVTQESYTRDIQNIFRNKFDLNVDLPVVFLDAYYTRSNSEEVDFFDQEIRKLWRVSYIIQTGDSQCNQDINMCKRRSFVAHY